MSKDTTTMIDKEELLIRSGDILNILGVLRSAKINNHSLTKNKFIELVKRNYGYKKDEPLPDKIEIKVNKVWGEAIEFFEEEGIISYVSACGIRIKEISEWGKKNED